MFFVLLFLRHGPRKFRLLYKILLAKILKKKFCIYFQWYSIDIFLTLELVERLKISKIILESKMPE